MSWVLWLAGLVNIAAVLVATRALTDDLLSALYPQIFSRAGLIGIILWGLAYFACARNIAAVPKLLLVFALEKLFYFGTWVAWMLSGSHQLSTLLNSEQLPALFMAVYGPNDLLFAVVFALMYLLLRRQSASVPKASAQPAPPA